MSTEQLTILAGILTIGVPAILTSYASLKAANNAAQVAARAVKISEENSGQLKEIHVAVNSNLSALKQELADSIKLQTELKNTIAILVSRASEVDAISVKARLDSLERPKI